MTSLARNQLALVRENMVTFLTINVPTVIDWNSQKTRENRPSTTVGRVEFAAAEVDPDQRDGSTNKIYIYGSIVFLHTGRDLNAGLGGFKFHRDLTHDTAWAIVYDILDAFARGSNCGGYFLTWDGKITLLPLGQINAVDAEGFLYEGEMPFKLEVRIPTNPQNMRHIELGENFGGF